MTATDPRTTIHWATFDGLSNRVLHDIAQLRSAVFVVEQDCVFLDLDGRDHEPGATHAWIEDGGGVVATLRVLDEGDDQWSVGRIATRADRRGEGLARRLLDAAVDRVAAAGARTVLLGGQAQLLQYYERAGFVVCGPRYLEDEILHVPMRRELRDGGS